MATGDGGGGLSLVAGTGRRLLPGGEEIFSLPTGLDKMQQVVLRHCGGGAHVGPE